MIGSGNSEQPSEISEFYSETRQLGGGQMSSVATAQSLTRDLGDILAPGEKWKRQISAVHRGLTSDKFEHSIKGLTWSRVKTWFYGEARRVNYEEVVALRELHAIEEARRARLKLAATANILAAHLAAAGAPLDGHQMRALGRLAGALDLSGSGDAR
ncbi:MAG: hypothetical protein E5Y10_22055 [Mesorhizobium sp.]|uniref:hypothetical protein n=1 Tax=Mesorhizobium sp. TaxID=1871066 RepID=UPI001222F1B4|nr:hypothetical protein [Mesorhizobium sp.]TIN36816.1 MAG: hypothetical protein E5Y13_22665 [Mesorhizobium sp.]TJU86661.1 MAG: hypothetical protein E5Y10_22055 [Mesorhizobium sp.]